MDIYKRVENLENLVNSLINTINNSKFYTDADIAGVRKNVGDITPYTETKTAYYGETEKVFYNVPKGITLVIFGNYNGAYSVNYVEGRLIVSFDALTQETDITISIQ